MFRLIPLDLIETRMKTHSKCRFNVLMLWNQLQEGKHDRNIITFFGVQCTVSQNSYILVWQFFMNLSSKHCDQPLGKIGAHSFFSLKTCILLKLNQTRLKMNFNPWPRAKAIKASFFQMLLSHFTEFFEAIWHNFVISPISQC